MAKPAILAVDDDVAVVAAVVRDLRYAIGVCLGQPGVGGDHSDGGVRAHRRLDAEALSHQPARIDQRTTVVATRSGHDAAGRGIDDVAHRVDRDQSGDDQVADPDLRGAETTLHGVVHAEQLAHVGILLLVHPRSDQDVGNARAVLERHAAREIQTPPDRSMV